ncbi:MAG: ribosome silencing factor [Puniceicoccales bacterium]|jgi:ribosome-associated protein|nr:ribosome silencing factor [Puniceicoccales bacterium]
MKESMRENFSEALSICYQITADKKCFDVKVFDVHGISGITDYMVLATCTSEPHLRAIGEELYQTFKHRYGQLCRVDYEPLSGWLVFDAFDVILHAFTESMRRKYDLDKLFAHSELLDLDCIFSLDICDKSIASTI